jgi:Nif-specific regulatory protein
MMTHAEGDRPGAGAGYTLADFSSADPAMRDCLELARTAARTDLPILILGESGTGKTLLARAIHNSSARASGAFVSFNAAALSDTLLDSQLFGHEKGAYTGAVKQVKGKFELADRGTLFIDEIADMSAIAQAKILRAVEYGEFERLGSETIRVADVRVISATHLPIASFLGSEQFRKDLFYRISGITIRIPPLRQRPNDLRALVGVELASAGRSQDKRIVGLSIAAADMLLSYGWPGNLRELKRVVQSAVALTPDAVIQPESLLLERADEQGPPSSAPRRAESEGVDARRVSNPNLSLRAVELRHIRRVLELMGGNKRRAAKALGLSRSTLDRKLVSELGALAPK